jgi:PTS system fructose-specific IIC component
MFIATLIARKMFDDSEHESGIAAAFMGFFGITEGAIPFAAAHPLSVIPANVIGSAIGAAMAGVLGVQSHVMWGGLIVAVLGGVGQPLLFVLCIAVGSTVTALLTVFLMRIGMKKKERSAAAVAPSRIAADDQPSSPLSPIDAAPAVATTAAGSTGGGVATKTRPATVLDYISEDTVLLDSASTDRDSMIKELVALGVKTGQVADGEVVLASALAREALMSTAVGEGIAIPHAKSSGAASPMVAFAKAQNIDWASPSGDLAKLVFLISVPEADAGDEHLRILAKLSRALARPAVRQSLQDAATKAQVLEVLRAAVD